MQKMVAWVPGWGWTVGFQNAFTGIFYPTWILVDKKKIYAERIAQVSVDALEGWNEPRGE